MKYFRLPYFFILVLCFSIVTGCAGGPKVYYHTNHTALFRLSYERTKSKDVNNAREALITDNLFTTNAIKTRYLNVILNLREQRSSILKSTHDYSDAQLYVSLAFGFIAMSAPTYIRQERRENVMLFSSAAGTASMGIFGVLKHSAEIDIIDKDIDNIKLAYQGFYSAVIPLVVKSSQSVPISDEELKQWASIIANMDNAFAKLQYSKSGVEMDMRDKTYKFVPTSKLDSTEIFDSTWFLDPTKINY